MQNVGQSNTVKRSSVKLFHSVMGVRSGKYLNILQIGAQVQNETVITTL